MTVFSALPLLLTLAQLPNPSATLVPPAALEAYAKVLRTHVKDGLVDYRGLEKHSLKELELFLDAAAKVPASGPAAGSKAARIALYIDTYNALVLRAVIRHERPRSVLDVKDFFKKRSYDFFGRTLSLDDLEKELIRSAEESGRYHMAVVCAAVSCPILESVPYQGSDLSRRLDAAARRYLASRHGAVVSEGKIALSRIFEWYEPEFGGKAGVLEFVRRYLSPEARAKLGSDPAVSYLEYNWTLNQQ